MHSADSRRHSPAAERNGAPILVVLQRLLPERGLMLEIASGTGQHAASLSAGLPGWQWQPTDFDAESLPSIRAWCAGMPRVRPPLRLDVLSQPWPPEVNTILPSSVPQYVWGVVMSPAKRAFTPYRSRPPATCSAIQGPDSPITS
jgi:hypothetical protein